MSPRHSYITQEHPKPGHPALQVVYGVWVGRKNPSSRAWKLEKNVHRADVRAECERCDSMGVRVILTVGGSGQVCRVCS